MKRRLITWLLTLSASMFVLPFGSCVQASLDGVVQSVEPCDFLNCQDPRFVDPCRFLQCNRTSRPITLTGE